MNDEDFARHAFAAAFRSGQTGEPPTLPDVELLASHGRRANRNRHGAYVAGTTALAGVVVAGVVTGPALLGFGTHSPSGIGTAAAGSTPPASPSPTPADETKPSPGVSCVTPPPIDWISVINRALPAGVTATADHSASCSQMPDGSRTVQALFKLSTGTVQLQVTVGSGPNIARKVGSAQGMIGDAPATDPSESLDPSTLASLQAQKQALASAGATGSGAPGSAASASPPPDSAAIASLEAQKQAIASAHATESPAPGAETGPGTKGDDNQTCSKVSSDENACLTHTTKGSLSVVDVQLVRTGSAPLIVDVAASNGKDPSVLATGQLPSDATMTALAEAVATHF
jgi:hypothetical protein